MEYVVRNIQRKIRENITPIGDGNTRPSKDSNAYSFSNIRENITPIGDGNKIYVTSIASIDRK